jgi:hypothetical protein
MLLLVPLVFGPDRNDAVGTIRTMITLKRTPQRKKTPTMKMKETRTQRRHQQPLTQPGAAANVRSSADHRDPV